MRIAVVHNLPPGGARRRVEGHLRGLEGEVKEFVLESATPVTDDAVIVPLTQRADSVPRALKPLVRYPDHLALLLAWRTLSRAVAAWSPDVVYLNPCRYLQTPPLADVGGAPIVYYCDEPRRADYEQQARSSKNTVTRLPYWLLHESERRADRRGVARASRVLTNSRYTSGTIRRAYGVDSHVVYCGVPELFTPAADALVPTHVLSVGTLIPTKGHDLVLEAVAGAGLDLPVVVVSPRSRPEEEQRLRALAERLGVQLSVRVGVSDDELLELFRRAFATMYLAVAEPYGLVSIEAQSSGCPVVVADEGGLPETVVDEAGVVVPRTAAAAARALVDLQDPRARDKAVVAARGSTARNTWAASSAQVLEHLRDVTGRARP
ncbi:glycosyltransferase involved in cell wall biosynthesis [Motilibacter rhizosphaerae]|uniref:Glycosyltransferase involved in cell wall biosynthesis n=1 Tax=Motilibacter rhizosphaerae TaxID=598652 RepID=A0A4V2F4E9_9ACTN|nr:glycosyltransferase [Motilibacter rhizosphaerae]RZS87367.1 glycosyltransferase involved in cell wall biosynthesis [Motilibacter rhizosphaerae]